MSLLLRHLEFLLRRHDCVTVPGIGALLVRYRHARFDRRCRGVLLPPSREVAFNGALTQSDGVIELSVARQCGVSFEVAQRMVAEEAAALRSQLDYFGSLQLGRIGLLKAGAEGALEFHPADIRRWDWRFFGLRPLCLTGAAASTKRVERAAAVPADAVGADASGIRTAASVQPWEGDEQPRHPFAEEAGEEMVFPSRGRVTRAVVGIAASLAVIVSLALFFLNPILVDTPPSQASIAPAPVERTAPETAAAVETEPDADAAPEYAEAVLPERDAMAGDVVAAEDAEANSNAAEAPRTALRFNPGDAFCVIVASFPDRAQAERYIAENPGKSMGVLHQDGKYRIYAATGTDYSEAASQKALLGAEGAWICRR